MECRVFSRRWSRVELLARLEASVFALRGAAARRALRPQPGVGGASFSTHGAKGQGTVDATTTVQALLRCVPWDEQPAEQSATKGAHVDDMNRTRRHIPLYSLHIRITRGTRAMQQWWTNADLARQEDHQAWTAFPFVQLRYHSKDLGSAPSCRIRPILLRTKRGHLRPLHLNSS